MATQTQHGSTLFVSNLPYTATSVDLQTLFSDIAPVRSAFVVTEHGTGVSKGVGYVSFSMKEDAQAAYDKLSKEGILLASRKLRVDWADHKVKHKTKDQDALAVQKEPKPRPAPRPSLQRKPIDPFAIRTIVVSGLPHALDSKQLWKKMRKYDGAEKVEWPHKLEDGTEDPTIAHVLFLTPAAANDAVTKLHAHVFKGSLLSVTLKKRLENLAKPVPVSGDGDQKPPTTFAPSHASRLIVRNLPFNITEQDLRAVFLPYGPIYSIHIPTVELTTSEVKAEEEVPVVKTKTRAKGFAFVWMLSKKDAEKALNECNGKLVRAGAAQAIVSDKQKKKKQKRLERKLKEAGKAKEDDEQDPEGQGAGVEGEGEEGPKEKVSERVIAVDWALSKDKWKEEQAKFERHAGEDVEMADESNGNEESGESEDEGEEVLGVHSGNEGSDDGSSGEDESEEENEEPIKPQLPAPEVGTTLFVRNVSFTATEDELRTLFRAFGPLRYARITMEPETGRSRGTGFVCFWNKEDADKVIEQSELLRRETTGNPPLPVKKNPFVLPSILAPDPSSSLAQSLALHGRTLDVVTAVTREQATKLREEGEKARQKADKRNMYLLKEGVILPNSPLAQNLPPAELERRTNSFNARRALLKSNPSLYISQTRLSIRQIPLFVTERVLKRLALHAVRSFGAEVKAGDRVGLTPDELADPSPITEDGDKDDRPMRKGKRFTGRATAVKQTKIVRQQDRVDAITGKGRSKGYGFIEMHKHSDALRVLRWANCNTATGPLFEQWYKEEMESLLKVEKAKDVKERDDARIKRIRDEIENGPTKKARGSLIVEFSIENIQVVKRRSMKQTEITDVKTEGGNEPRKRKSRSESPAKKDVADTSSPKKKRRLSTGTTDSEAKNIDPNLKPGRSIGSIIGRKRKERRKSKKG